MSPHAATFAFVLFFVMLVFLESHSTAVFDRLLSLVNRKICYCILLIYNNNLLFFVFVVFVFSTKFYVFVSSFLFYFNSFFIIICFCSLYFYFIFVLKQTVNIAGKNKGLGYGFAWHSKNIVIFLSHCCHVCTNRKISYEILLSRIVTFLSSLSTTLNWRWHLWRRMQALSAWLFAWNSSSSMSIVASFAVHNPLIWIWQVFWQFFPRNFMTFLLSFSPWALAVLWTSSLAQMKASGLNLHCILADLRLSVGSRLLLRRI